MEYDVTNLDLAAKGELRLEWAGQDMPVLKIIQERFRKEQPLAGSKIAACLHVTSETANLAITLKAGGADVRLCASNPLSTQDDIAAALVKNHGIPVFARKGEDGETYYRHINSALVPGIQITMDDGADLVSTLHQSRTELLPGIIGGTEETTTGVIRLKSMAAHGVLKYPIIAVNDADTKHMFDNRYGTGQSTLDGIIRATNRLIAGRNCVVCGYGWCGRGTATRLRGLGGNVIVTEVDPIKALEAVMDGFRVMPIAAASELGDIFVTLTGDINVISQANFAVMKDGAIVCNSGHFNVELDLVGLESITVKKRQIREFTVEHTLTSGSRIYVLGEGRLINLAAAEGHPASVMDMSFANQALAAEYLMTNAKTLERKVYSVPRKLDEEIATMKLASMKITIDVLTAEQKNYLASWQLGT